MAHKPKFIKQTASSGNAYAAAYNLLQLLGVKATPPGLSEMLRTHHAYPGIAAIADTLEELGLDAMAVKLNPSQLHEAGFPCIAHLKKNGGHFVVLAEASETEVMMIDPLTGETKLPVSQFIDEWSGAAVLVSSNENAGERGYDAKHRAELIDKSRLPLAIAIIASLSVFSIALIFQSPNAAIWSTLFAVKAAGLTLSILLLMHYFSTDNKLMQRLCPAGKKLDCNSILHTPAAKIFNLIPMADIGALYFAGGSLSLLFMSFAPADNVIWLLAMLNLLTLPYTVFSISYQAFVAKQWCWLCVAVQGLLWAEFFIFLGYGYLEARSVDTSTLIMSLWAFLLPVAVWMIARPLIQGSQQAVSLTEQVLRFKRNPYLFGTMLNRQRKINRGQLPAEIELGDASAPLVITMITQPQCPACAYTHQYIETLADQFPGLVKVIIRFNCPLEDHSRQIARGVISIALTGNKERVQKALNSGYKVRGEAALKQWKTEYENIKNDPAMVESILDHHVQWCNSLSIKATPVFYIDDHPLPDGFTVFDIRPLLKLKQEEMEIA